MSNEPLTLHTQNRGRENLLLAVLVAMLLLNLVWAMTFRSMAANFNKPRIVMSDPATGIILPLASGVFAWNPSTGESFIKQFLPQIYTFSPAGMPPKALFGPFINPVLFEATQQRYENERAAIEAEGVCQTLLVTAVQFDKKLESAMVSADLRRLNRGGQVTHTPITLTVELMTTADPLNPYGHILQTLH